MKFLPDLFFLQRMLKSSCYGNFRHQIGLEEKGCELSLAIYWRELKSRRRITLWMESKMAYYSVMWLRKNLIMCHDQINIPQQNLDLIYSVRASYDYVYF